MSDRVRAVVSLRIDLSALVRRSVTSLYSNLVTRPTGRALRLGIETQITDVGMSCLSILDFSEVVVLDYSCADEAVAKLIYRFQQVDAPAEVYFLARGLGDPHRETLEAVLARHHLALVVESEVGDSFVLGELPSLEMAVWMSVQRLSYAEPPELAAAVARSAQEVEIALDGLVRRRLIWKDVQPGRFHALTSLANAGE